MKKLRVLILLTLSLLLCPVTSFAAEMPECDVVYSVAPNFSSTHDEVNYFIFDVGNKNDLYVKIHVPIRAHGSIQLLGTDIKDEFYEDDFYRTNGPTTYNWLLYHIGPITDDAIRNDEIAIKFIISGEAQVEVMQVKNKKDNISSNKNGGKVQIKVEANKLPEVIEDKRIEEGYYNTPTPSATPAPTKTPSKGDEEEKKQSQSTPKPTATTAPTSSQSSSQSSSNKKPEGYKTKVTAVIKTFGIKPNGVIHATAKAKTDKLIWRIKSLHSGRVWSYTGTKKFSNVMANEKVAYSVRVSEDGKVWSNEKIVMPFASIKTVKGRKITWRKVDTARTYEVLIKTKTKKGYKVYKETKKRSIKLKRPATVCIRAKSRLYASKMKDGCSWVIVK